MTDVLKDMQTAPVLTLDPLKEMARGRAAGRDR